MRIHCLENVDKALQFLRDQRVHLENMGSHDIVDGSARLTLGLIWTIILRFQVIIFLSFLVSWFGMPRVNAIDKRKLVIIFLSLFVVAWNLDPRHHDRRDRQPRNTFGQGCPLVVVSNEDSRLPQCQYSKFHYFVARRTGIQRHHSQTLPGIGPV